MPWQLSSLIALTCFSFAFLAFRAIGRSGIGAVPLLIHVSAIGLACYIVHHGVRGGTLAMPRGTWALVAVAAVACYVGNICQINALTRAANPGHALAIINASVALVSVAAMPLFNAPVGALKGAGIALCLVGVIIVCVSP